MDDKSVKPVDLFCDSATIGEDLTAGLQRKFTLKWVLKGIDITQALNAMIYIFIIK